MDRSEFAIEYIITTSPNPITQQDAIARVTLYDFLYQVLCCFSFWVGFSFLSLSSVLVETKASELAVAQSAAKRKLMLSLAQLDTFLYLARGEEALLKRMRSKLVRRKLMT